VFLKTIKNVAGSWLGLAATMVVGFLLTPFILHRLGNTALGLWVLITSFTGYYGLLDLGIRNAIVQYVARYQATDEAEELTKVVSTGFFTYGCVALLAIAITLLAAANLQSWFKLAPDDRATAHALLLIVGIGTAIGMPVTVFTGVLEGLQKFAFIGAIQTLAVVLRAGLIVAGLTAGRGIVFVGGATVAVNLAASLVLMGAALRSCPPNLLKWNYVSRSTLGALAGFGVVTFWMAIAQVLRFQLDAMVVAAFISVPAVTFFAAGGKLASSTMDVVATMAQVFTPMSSAFHATGRFDGLRRVLVVGNRYCAFVAFPLASALLLIGSRFIQAWLGAPYVSSQSVLMILIVPTALWMAQASSLRVLYGMHRHKTLAVVLLLEAAANLVLSVALARPYGINGVAMGTAIPLFCTSVLFLPIHLCRELQLRLRDFVFDCFAYPLLLTLPLALALRLLDTRIPGRSWRELLEILLIAGLLYGLELLVYFRLVEFPQMSARRSAAVAAQKVSQPDD
jgi:O-antigen/teichoic acid export membrane protein